MYLTEILRWKTFPAPGFEPAIFKLLLLCCSSNFNIGLPYFVMICTQQKIFPLSTYLSLGWIIVQKTHFIQRLKFFVVVVSTNKGWDVVIKPTLTKDSSFERLPWKMQLCHETQLLQKCPIILWVFRVLKKRCADTKTHLSLTSSHTVPLTG